MVTGPILKETITHEGVSLYDLSSDKTVLLVFLRHFGCVFCKEAMKDLSKKRTELERRGVELVFVHMSDNDTAQAYFNKYKLKAVKSISDPSCKLYAEFGLVKGSASQLFGLKNWARGFEVVLKDPSILSLKQIGDGFQMPGVFLIQQGKIMESFIHQSAADRPDYMALVDCCAA